ncbi:hypothetical protein [Streptomyces sp. H27-C3]|uniref:hypothetical protein n=1 Tax=Streptomyces sp. H27-C3 TaxID=3046305 RepID=UPI0032D8F45F
MRPLLDGSDRRAPSADPARVLTHAVGVNRTSAFLPDTSVAVTGGRLCAQVHPDPARACLDGEKAEVSPHFASWEASPEPGRDAVAMSWSKPGTPARVRPAKPISLAGAEALALRVIAPPNTTGTELDVTLVDTKGRRATLGQARVDGLPDSARTASYWAREIRVPLSAAVPAKLDLKHVTALELTPRTGSGRAWLMDTWGWRPGTPAVRAAALPRVDIGRLAVKEGNAGERTYRMPVNVSGKGSGRVRLFVPKPGTDEVTSRVVTVRPGSSAIDIPVTVKGNTRYDYDISHDAFVKAVRGVAVGSHRGGVTALNDDPMPKVSVTPVKDRVTEGPQLTWRMSLAQAADADVMAEVAFQPLTNGVELSTMDVDPRWLEETFGESPSPARPLSRMTEGAALYVSVPPGTLSAEMSVPTVADGISEPEESLKLQVTIYDQAGEPQPGPALTGTVRDGS